MCKSDKVVDKYSIFCFNLYFKVLTVVVCKWGKSPQKEKEEQEPTPLLSPGQKKSSYNTISVRAIVHLIAPEIKFRKARVYML